MAAAVARVRLPPEGASNATSATHRTRTLSHSGSDGALTMASGQAAEEPPTLPDGAAGALAAELTELRGLVQHLEALQAQQRSPQQSTPELDSLLGRVLEGRPEWRARMAVLTRSAVLRQKILAVVPGGTRSAGSAALGSTHAWRQPAAERTLAAAGLSPSGAAPSVPSEKLRMDPTISHSYCFSLPRARRFEGMSDTGEVQRAALQRRGTPGPGAYSKSLPRGTAFHDGGERVVLGANHTYAFRRVLGRQINPVDVDATSLPSAPAYSFAGARRTLSETAVGHGQRDGGPVKSDLGALTPGPVYEQMASMRPEGGAGGLRRTRSRPPGGAGPRVRCVPVPPEPVKEAEPLEREEH